MVGGGQLARMTHQAAVDLDVELLVLATTPDEPAVLAGAPYRLGSHTDPDALAALAEEAPVVTFDHELVPNPLLRSLEAAGHVLRPGAAALAYAQDKLHARSAMAAAGLPVPAFAEVASGAEVAEFAEEHGWPVVCKARSGGYDGRGVVVAGGPADLPDLSAGWLVEEHVELRGELAVLVARRPSGGSVTYPVVATTQVDGICTQLVGPVEHPDATALAARVVERIGAVGICAVELFVGDGGRLLVNEVALRPHNSGHATIEGNRTSQFHNHLRAVLDWPLGPTDAVAASAMVNLIAPDALTDPADRLPEALAVPGAQVHLYAKPPRPGRKVGHVTALGATVDEALATASEAADILLMR